MKIVVRNFLAALVLVSLAAAPAFGAATIVIVNADAAGEGFNDPTVVAPVGGNPGTTLGQQRLIAFQHAADIWGSLLDSDVPIRVLAAFNPLTCTPTAATLGSAAAIQVFAFNDTTFSELPLTWHPVALANKLVGADLVTSGGSSDDLVAQFNSDLDNPVCLGAIGWYYGLDNNHGTDNDLVTVLLHEFAHGLGFANFINEANGILLSGLPDVYSTYTYDIDAGKGWNAMTNAERIASSLNDQRIVWSGINVRSAAPGVLSSGTIPRLTLNSPNLGVFAVGPAQFGAALSSPGVTGDLVIAQDVDEDGGAAVATATDGCSAILNSIAGKVAFVDRGNCNFTVKAKNVQDAGAVAMVVGDNTSASAPPTAMTGVDPAVTIPSGRVSLRNANRIKALLGSGTVNVTLGLRADVLDGADPLNRPYIYAPEPLRAGSTLSHFDVSATPNLLMEPAINPDLTHDVDLALEQMVDIGWFTDLDGVPDGQDQCIGSSRDATVVLGDCDSLVPNTTFTTGCRITDHIDDCLVGSANQALFVKCVESFTRSLKRARVITEPQKEEIEACAVDLAADHY
ncbi:MAG TPA: PA domain-containing protein [Thermoanaerobaculia bacterium]